MTKSPGRALIESCSTARCLFIAAPYIKEDALDKVLTDAKSADSLVCVTRWRPDDIVTGVSDTGCRTLITQRRGSFRLHPSLHAKYYRIDDIVFVGSANLTASAMGWAPHPNLEIFCRAGDDFDAEGFERELLRDSREISHVEFACWEALGKVDLGSRIEISGLKPMLDAWRPATRDLQNLELAYRDRGDEIASFDEQMAARRDIQALSIPPDLTDDEFRAWISICVLEAPFTNYVIQLSDTDKRNAANSLAETYGLSLTVARRDMETVQNWLSFLNLGISRAT